MRSRTPARSTRTVACPTYSMLARGGPRRHVAILRRRSRGRPGRESRFRACRRQSSPTPSRPPQRPPLLSVNFTVRTMLLVAAIVGLAWAFVYDPRSGDDAVPRAVRRPRARARRAADAATQPLRPWRLRDDSVLGLTALAVVVRAAAPDPARRQLPRLRRRRCPGWSRTSRTTRRSARGSTSTAGARDRAGEREGDRAGHRRRGGRRHRRHRDRASASCSPSSPRSS